MKYLLFTQLIFGKTRLSSIVVVIIVVIIVGHRNLTLKFGQNQVNKKLYIVVA